MAKKGKKRPENNKSRLSMTKRGTFDPVATFSLLDHDELEISRSYYNKLKKRIRNNIDIPLSIKNKAEKIINSRDKYVIKLYTGTKTNIKVPKDIIKKHNLKRKKLYTWVRFKVSSRGYVYGQSFTIPNTKLKNINKILNDYIKLNVKKYQDHPIFIHGISFQNV